MSGSSESGFLLVTCGPVSNPNFSSFSQRGSSYGSLITAHGKYQLFAKTGYFKVRLSEFWHFQLLRTALHPHLCTLAARSHRERERRVWAILGGCFRILAAETFSPYISRFVRSSLCRRCLSVWTPVAGSVVLLCCRIFDMIGCEIMRHRRVTAD